MYWTEVLAMSNGVFRPIGHRICLLAYYGVRKYISNPKTIYLTAHFYACGYGPSEFLR